jgi:hypothetical protein
MLSLTTLAAVMLGTANAATVTVTNIDDGVSNVGAPGTLYWAITNCNAGDTIAFNIDTGVHGPGPYYFASSGMFWGFFIERDKGPIHPGGKRCPS